MASMRKKVVVRWLMPDGKRTKPHAQGARRVREDSTKWYAFGVPGSKGPIPLATSKRVAEQMLARLVTDGELAVAGMATSAERGKSVAVLIGEYEARLVADGATERHGRQVAAKLRRVATDLDWRQPRRLTADAVGDWLCRLLSEGGRGPQTRNHYLVTIRAFVRWLALPPRRLIQGDLLDTLTRVSVDVDQRRARRALTPDELARLLTATQASDRVLRGLSGRQRHLLYVVAATSGFRAAELGSLCVNSLDLDANPPCILLAARKGKNRRPVRQPVPTSVAQLLRTHVQGMQDHTPLWPGGWETHTAEFLRKDLAAAGVPYVVAGPDGPLHADFHALRHTFVAHLELAGVSLRDAMQLARHSDPRLTMARYGRSQADALGRAVEGLPGFGNNFRFCGK